jgi:excisionase family DNA binding protein
VAEPQTWFTLREAADYCRCSTVTLGREARRGTLKAFKLARRREWRFSRTDLDQWMQASTTPVAYQPKSATRLRSAS